MSQSQLYSVNKTKRIDAQIWKLVSTTGNVFLGGVFAIHKTEIWVSKILAYQCKLQRK